jgi:hypothetical protein
VTTGGYSRLGEILVASGDVTRTQITDALRRQSESGRRLGEILVEEGIASADQIAKALALQFDYPYAHFEAFPIDTAAIAAVPEHVARRHVVCPLRKLNTDLYCAAADPIDVWASDELERVSDCNLQLLIATPQEVVREVDRRYGAVSAGPQSPLPLAPGGSFMHYHLVTVRWEEPAVVFFEANDERLLRKVLLAVVRPAGDEDEHDGTRAQRFLEHSMWLARFPHRNIVTIHDVGEYDGLRFVVSEALPGETLRERLDRERRLALSSVGGFALQICEALRHLHGYQLVYQTLSPGNCVILPGEALKLTHLEVRPSPNEYETHRLLPADEYRYCSPEQLAGEPLDYRSDIFTLGSLIYEMAAGRPAFPGPSVAAVTQLLREGAILAADELPADLNRLILRACARERHARFPDTPTMSEELLALHWPAVAAAGGVEEFLREKRCA